MAPMFKLLSTNNHQMVACYFPLYNAAEASRDRKACQEQVIRGKVTFYEG